MLERFRTCLIRNGKYIIRILRCRRFLMASPKLEWRFCVLFARRMALRGAKKKKLYILRNVKCDADSVRIFTFTCGQVKYMS